MQIPKYIPYRNKQILAYANGKACTHCGKKDGTVIAAHSNLSSDGKGVGKKSDDCFVAFLCSECHRNYDLKIRVGRLGTEVRPYKVSQTDFDQAMKKTWKLLLQDGILVTKPTLTITLGGPQ